MDLGQKVHWIGVTCLWPWVSKGCHICLQTPGAGIVWGSLPWQCASPPAHHSSAAGAAPGWHQTWTAPGLHWASHTAQSAGPSWKAHSVSTFAIRQLGPSRLWAMTKCTPASCEPTPVWMTAAAVVLAACTANAQHKWCDATEPLITDYRLQISICCSCGCSSSNHPVVHMQVVAGTG